MKKSSYCVVYKRSILMMPQQIWWTPSVIGKVSTLENCKIESIRIKTSVEPWNIGCPPSPVIRFSELRERDRDNLSIMLITPAAFSYIDEDPSRLFIIAYPRGRSMAFLGKHGMTHCPATYRPDNFYRGADTKFRDTVTSFYKKQDVRAITWNKDFEIEVFET